MDLPDETRVAAVHLLMIREQFGVLVIITILLEDNMGISENVLHDRRRIYLN